MTSPTSKLLPLLVFTMLSIATNERAVAEDGATPKDPSTIVGDPKLGEKPPSKPENNAISWGPKEIRELKELAQKNTDDLLKLSPADMKKWLKIDEHERYSYRQLKILSLIKKTFTRDEWDSMFGNSLTEGQSGLIGWVGAHGGEHVALVEYILPWTGKPRMLDAAHGHQALLEQYALVVP